MHNKISAKFKFEKIIFSNCPALNITSKFCNIFLVFREILIKLYKSSWWFRGPSLSGLLKNPFFYVRLPLNFLHSHSITIYICMYYIGRHCMLMINLLSVSSLLWCYWVDGIYCSLDHFSTFMFTLWLLRLSVCSGMTKLTFTVHTRLLPSVSYGISLSNFVLFFDRFFLWQFIPTIILLVPSKYYARLKK